LTPTVDYMLAISVPCRQYLFEEQLEATDLQ
jgi:hypothetical protein